MPRTTRFPRFFLGICWLTAGLHAQPSRDPLRIESRVGEFLRFTASAEGEQPESFLYQWRKDGVPIAGATAKTLLLPVFDVSDSGFYDVIVRNGVGSAGAEAVSVVVKPVQPLATSDALFGGTVTISVPLEFAPDTQYQWRLNGLSIAGATEASLTLPNVTQVDLGSYTVIIKTASIEFATAPAWLRPPQMVTRLPVITSEPLDLIVTEGKSLALFVGASEPASLEYQWKLDGTNLLGATGQTLWLHAAKPGLYTVDVSSPAGTVTSRAAVVTLVRGQGRIANASSISKVRAGTSEMTGFVVSGVSSKTFLLRAVGPTLLELGLSDVLADPFLQLYDSRGRLVRANDNWNDGAPEETALITSAAASAGAYALKETGRDAAFLVNLNPGAYILRSNEGVNSPGLSITEIYDVDTSRLNATRLVNLSKSDVLERPTDTVLSGFVVDGAPATTVLVRAVGPGLKPLGITNAAPQVQITVYNGANQIVATNTVWESAGVPQAVINAAARISAFPLSRGSADSCILISLPPGAYTAQLTSVGGSIGPVIQEVYEIP